MSEFIKKHPYFCVVLSGALLYLRCLSFDFSYLDDQALVLGNQAFLSRFSNIIPAFRTDVFSMLHAGAAYYRPLLTVSFILDAQWGGVAPAAYHLTNLLIHLAVSCLVYRFLTALEYREGVALFFALVFTVHPALTQVVACIACRNDSLLTFFALAAFISLEKFLRTGSARAGAGHLLCFILALFSKETAVAIIPMALVFLAGLSRERLFSRKTGLLGLGWSASLAVWLWLRHAALVNPIKTTVGDMALSAWRSLPALVPFAGKIVLPFNLAVLPVLPDASFLYGSVAFAVLAWAMLVSRGQSWPRVAFGLAWFLLFLLPSFVRPDPAAIVDLGEHRLYLPMIGAIVLLCELDWVRARAAAPRAAPYAAGLGLALLAALAWRHSGDFKDRLHFWRSAAATSPHSPLAHRNLGAMYYLDGRPDLAEPEYLRALELNAREPMAHNNLGLIYMQRGKLQAAEREYRQELAVNPDYDNAFFNFGLLCYAQGRFSEAEDLWKRTLQSNPDYIDAYRDLALLYYQRKDFTQARAYAELLQKRGVPSPFARPR